mgnify:FL=1
MKKKYIKPEIQVHEIKAQQMLTGSQPEFNNGIPEDKNEEMW